VSAIPFARTPTRGPSTLRFGAWLDSYVQVGDLTEVGATPSGVAPGSVGLIPWSAERAAAVAGLPVALQRAEVHEGRASAQRPSECTSEGRKVKGAAALRHVLAWR
jgi:hypothetical protein